MKAVFNIPNTLSCLRILSVPAYVYFLVQPEAWQRQLAFAIFLLASLTDWADGYIARKYRQETEFGRFLDPLADKAIVIGSLLAFVSITEQIQLWMILCIIARDVLISLLRYLAIQRGSYLRTSVFSKIKTAFQMFSITIVFMSFLLINYAQRDSINEMYRNEKENYGLTTWKVASENLLNFVASFDQQSALFALASFLPYFLMLITTVFTIISGLRYLYANHHLFWCSGNKFDGIKNLRS